MVKKRRRDFMKKVANIIRNSRPGFYLLVVLVAGLLLSPAPTDIYPSLHARSATRSPQAAESEARWVPLKIIDTNKMDWVENPSFGAKSKFLYYPEGRGGPRLLLNTRGPGLSSDLTEAHYHTFHEWFFLLEGDSLIYEFVRPDQKKGTLVHMKAGTWMERPAYSIHGISIHGMGIHGMREDAMVRQRIPPGATSLIFTEGGGQSPDGKYIPRKTIAFDPKSTWYDPQSKEVKQFTFANFLDTASTEFMEWESDRELPGASVKWLSDNQLMGFRARLRFAPSGWTYPKAPEKSYYRQANRFVYVIYGDMNIWTYDSPSSPGTKVVAKKDFFIHQAPMSIWGYGEGPVTESGCMWLEVTYAKGASIGGGPIEEPILLVPGKE